MVRTLNPFFASSLLSSQCLVLPPGVYSRSAFPKSFLAKTLVLFTANEIVLTGLGLLASSMAQDAIVLDDDVPMNSQSFLYFYPSIQSILRLVSGGVLQNRIFKVAFDKDFTLFEANEIILIASDLLGRRNSFVNKNSGRARSTSTASISLDQIQIILRMRE